MLIFLPNEPVGKGGGVEFGDETGDDAGVQAFLERVGFFGPEGARQAAVAAASTRLFGPYGSPRAVQFQPKPWRPSFSRLWTR